jgi:hypothetical protein
MNKGGGRGEERRNATGREARKEKRRKEPREGGRERKVGRFRNAKLINKRDTGARYRVEQKHGEGSRSMTNPPCNR